MIDFGLVDIVDAEAIGEPGQRTFRVRARVADSSAALWLEKEQLAALGRAISRLLAERAPRERIRPEPQRITAFGPYPDVDLHAARIGLDYDAEQGRVIVLMDDAEAIQRGNSPAFRMEVGRAAALGLAQTIARVVASGRPLCPLCGQPLEGDGSHFCPGSNGHSKELPLPREEDD